MATNASRRSSSMPCGVSVLRDREYALGHRAEEHVRELQTLGRMDGHEPHLVLRIVHSVGVREQSRVRQIVLERHFLPARRLELVYGLL